MAGMSVGGEDMATELGAIPSADSMYVFAMQASRPRAPPASCRWGRWASSRTSTTSSSIEPACGAARRWASPRPSCIHPAHVPIINEEYGASAAEIDRARRLLAAFDAAAAAGAGAVAFEGSMIYLPVVIRARRLLERAQSWAR